ncbi:MAG: guanylate kinase [Gammaproteobacteria bacterium TMED234]|nr:MAG: guanylate kinase [Gammaproteobacteria bacterium TMED234]|tara:strand:- start:424 stop:1047 length:624 start_codon:yes stop_codon:yes gene_type:complete
MSNNKTKAKLIIFSAPSGAGKSSLIKEVISRSSGNIQLSISATTRPPRDGEEHGRDYFFISDEEFNELKNQNSFVEYANVYGYQYGTLRSFVDEKIENNINVILDIDVQGFDLIRNSINDGISIFIIPPSIMELEKRLISRGLDSDDVIRKRLKNVKTELKYAELYDHIILNDQFENAINELTSIIYNEDYISNKEINTNLLKDLLD